MDVTLHIGAHRTGTTTLQKFLNANETALTASGCMVWGPNRTRDGFLSGMFRHPEEMAPDGLRQIGRARGRIGLGLAEATWRGMSQIVISDENIMGSFNENLRAGTLYPFLSARLARFQGLFNEPRLRICLSLRSYETFWASSLAYAINKGHKMPSDATLDCFVTQPRRWRALIEEMLRLFPTAEVVVWPFERFVGQPDCQLDFLMRRAAPKDLPHKRHWHNASPSRSVLAEVLQDRGEQIPAHLEGEGRWQPFASDHIDAMKAQYSEDLMWLANAAPNRVEFIPDAEAHLRWVNETKGREHNDGIERRVG